MIGIVVVSNGYLGQAFVNSAQQIVGSQRQIENLSIMADDNAKQRQDDLAQAVSRVNTGSGVVILTDMFGGAASHIAMSMLKMPMVEVISGMNMPMLVKLLSKRKDATLAECVSSAEKAGKKYINVATKLLEPERKAG